MLLRGAAGAVVLALVALGGQYVAGYGTLAPVAISLLLVAFALYVVGRVARLRTEGPRLPPDEGGGAGEAGGAARPPRTALVRRLLAAVKTGWRASSPWRAQWGWA